MNKEKRIGNVVQVGIDRMAELAFLVKDDWREHVSHRNETAFCSDSFFEGIDTWHYFGVDSNIYSIVHILDALGHGDDNRVVERSKWLCAAISADTIV